MSLSIKEKNILQEMNSIRFMEKGIEEIERFGELARELRRYNSIHCIPELCAMMEDSASNCSAVEYVIETILIIIKQDKNGLADGINKVIESIERMKGHGDDWAIMLHTQFLFDNDLRDIYVQCAKNSEKKEDVLEILEILKEENDIKMIDFDDIINRIL